MSFNFGTPKTASGFTLPSTNTPATTSSSGFTLGVGAGDPAKPVTVPLGSIPSTGGFQLGGSDGSKPTAATQPTFSFGAPVASTVSTTSTGLTFGAPATSAPPPQFGAITSSAAPPAKSTALSFTPIAKTSLSTAPTTAAPTLGAPAAKISFGATPLSAPASTAPTLSLGLAASSTTTALTTTSTAVSTTQTVAPLPTTGSITFGQLEDSINKWTIDLEEQSKLFINQAKQLNAWDILLISNGDKVLNLNNGIERVKQQQQQLDQELDFVLAQQKELEELILPLEKELDNIPITDQDRNQTYQLAEQLDSQLKQMSEDLKEIIENLNESNKTDEISDPVTQISRIMNVHMNSLQWIDRNTAQVSTHLEQISKLHDLNRKNYSM